MFAKGIRMSQEVVSKMCADGEKAKCKYLVGWQN